MVKFYHAGYPKATMSKEDKALHQNAENSRVNRKGGRLKFVQYSEFKWMKRPIY